MEPPRFPGIPVFGGLTPTTEPPVDPDDRHWSQEPGHLFPWLAAWPILGLAAIGGYAAAVGGWISLALGSLVALASLLAGGLIGFIFAIPKPVAAAISGATQTGQPRLISNDNLVEVSDWLTKILVGLGLVQFGRAVDGGSVLVDSISGALGNAAGADVFAGCVLAVYALIGFLSVYILTRIYVGPLFARSDEAMRIKAERQVEQLVAEKIAGLEATIDAQRDPGI